jgi:Helix-turn-helix domain
MGWLEVSNQSFRRKGPQAVSADDAASTAGRGAQIRGPVEFPKYVTIAGKPELARDAEHEMELHAGESTSNSEQLVRTSLDRIGAPVIDKPRVLLPFDIAEALTVAQAARIAGRSTVTLRTWAAIHDLGRPIRRRWMISRVALAMFLESDRKALKAYLAGDRESRLVVSYFERFGLDPKEN